MFQSKDDQRILEELHLNILRMTQRQRNERVFLMIRDNLIQDGGEVLRRNSWSILNRPVCVDFWCYITGVSKTKTGASRELLIVGHTGPLQWSETSFGEARMPPQRLAKATATADTFFHQMYTDIAEYLAKPEPGEEGQDAWGINSWDMIYTFPPLGTLD